jgi:flavin reductase (DIM6/NTAB) family NADH-FMN oxidoreductase RutF
MSAAPTPLEWRAAMGRFPSGVTIVTAFDGDAPVGTTVNAFCSVSLDPPLLLICLDHSNPALRPIEATGRFGVNFLTHAHSELARLFGRDPDADRFSSVPFQAAPDEAPHIIGANVFIACHLEQAHGAGDHRILVGRGARIDHCGAEPPLLYHKGRFPSPSDPAAWE